MAKSRRYRERTLSAFCCCALVAGGISYQVWIDGKHDVLASSRHVRQRNQRLPSNAVHVVAASQHKHAMAHATEKSVLGDFSDVAFDTTVCARASGTTVLVETDGSDGKIATGSVHSGSIRFSNTDRADGRLQALSIAWIADRSTGGQRWFHLYPNEEIRHDDVLLDQAQPMELMRADAFDGVRKNYDAAKDHLPPRLPRSASAGPPRQGSRHVGGRGTGELVASVRPTIPQRARRSIDERSNVAWPIESKRKPQHRAATRKEVRHGLCHARRGQFSEN